MVQRKNNIKDGGNQMTEQNKNLESQEVQKNEWSTNSKQEEVFDQEDIEKNKTMAGLSYLIFFLPLIACPESRYGKFHANQALLLLIVSIAGNIVLGIIPIIGWILIPLFLIAVCVFGIMGLINGFSGKAKRLPLFGKFTIIK
jgi:uncharacterized membrane protein